MERGNVGRFRQLEGETLNTFRERYKRLQWIIIDEISMVSSETFLMIHKRVLQLFTTDSGRLDKPFGGLSVLVFGDLYQLKPVNGYWIFQQYSISEPFLRPYFRFVELITNVRQENDRRMLDLCNYIRIGDVTPEDVKLLKTRHIDKLHATQLNDAIRSYIYIYLYRVYLCRLIFIQGYYVSLLWIAAFFELKCVVSIVHEHSKNHSVIDTEIINFLNRHCYSLM